MVPEHRQCKPHNNTVEENFIDLMWPDDFATPLSKFWHSERQPEFFSSWEVAMINSAKSIGPQDQCCSYCVLDGNWGGWEYSVQLCVCGILSVAHMKYCLLGKCFISACCGSAAPPPPKLLEKQIWGLGDLWKECGAAVQRILMEKGESWKWWSLAFMQDVQKESNKLGFIQISAHCEM